MSGVIETTGEYVIEKWSRLGSLIVVERAVEGDNKVAHAQLENLLVSFSQVDMVRWHFLAGKLVSKILLVVCYQPHAGVDKPDVTPHLDTKM